MTLRAALRASASRSPGMPATTARSSPRRPTASTEFDDDPAGLVVTCRRLLMHHPDCAPLWWLCARVLAAPDPSEAAWEAEGARARRPHPWPTRGAAPLPARASRSRCSAGPSSPARRSTLASRPRSARGAAARTVTTTLARTAGAQRRYRAARRCDRGLGARAVARARRDRGARARHVRWSSRARPTLLEQLTKPTTLVWLVAGVGPGAAGPALRRDDRPLDAAGGPRPRARRRADRRPHRRTHGARAPGAPRRRVDCPVAPELLRLG